MDGSPLVSSLPQVVPAQSVDAVTDVASELPVHPGGDGFLALLASQMMGLLQEGADEHPDRVRSAPAGTVAQMAPEDVLQFVGAGVMPAIIPVQVRPEPVSPDMVAVSSGALSGGQAGGKDLPLQAVGGTNVAGPGAALMLASDEAVALSGEHRDVLLTPEASSGAHKRLSGDAEALRGMVAPPAPAVGSVPANGAGAGTVFEPRIAHAVGSENWAAGLGDKVVWMVGHQVRGAEIHLNPPALGPLEIRIHVADGQANVSFTTQHVAVRDAIENAAPRLREMLGDAGISMGSVSVNVGTQQQFASQDAPHQNASAWSVSPGSWVAEATGEQAVVMVQPLRGRGLVDLFA
jgi:flagellar hook-length control protein FliK